MNTVYRDDKTLDIARDALAEMASHIIGNAPVLADKSAQYTQAAAQVSLAESAASIAESLAAMVAAPVSKPASVSDRQILMLITYLDMEIGGLSYLFGDNEKADKFSVAVRDWLDEVKQ